MFKILKGVWEILNSEVWPDVLDDKMDSHIKIVGPTRREPGDVGRMDRWR